MSDTNKINEIIQSSLAKIRELSETGTIIGDAINTESGTVIIPVSKVSIGFAAGGVDIGSKNHTGAERIKNSGESFGGGGGTGLTVTPIGFLVVSPSGDVRMVPVSAPASVNNNNPIASIGELLEKTPDIVRKFKELFSKGDNAKADRVFNETEEEGE